MAHKHDIRVNDTLIHQDGTEFLIGKVDDIGVYLNWDGGDQLHYYPHREADSFFKQGNWRPIVRKKKLTIII